jgi:hypothetical protein
MVNAGAVKECEQEAICKPEKFAPAAVNGEGATILYAWNICGSIAILRQLRTDDHAVEEVSTKRYV